MRQPTKSQLESKRDYYTNIVTQQPFRPIQLNVSLASNPFLKHHQTYNYILFTLNDFNKRIAQGLVKDPYQQMSFQRLQSCVSDLAQMQTKEDQVSRLDQIYKWCKEQERLIDQRRDQGHVRYKTMNKVENQIYTQNMEPKEQQKVQQNHHLIPTELMQRLMGPYSKYSRTIHKQLDIPPNRLLQYKRKVINIAPFIQTKQQIKPPRINYNAPPKYQEPHKEEEDKDQKQGVKEGQVKDGQVKGDVKQGQVKEQEQQQDLGGFGEEPEQPQQQQKVQDQQDKLNPRIKAYTSQIDQPKKKYYRGMHMNYRGQQIEVERRMDLQFWRSQNDKLNIQRQQQQYINLEDNWGRKKSKIEKQLQKRLEEMTLKPKLDISKQPPPITQKISIKDQLKFGFTVPMKNNNDRKKSFDLTTLALPKIGVQQFNQKYMRKQRLKSLKDKFSKLLNLSDFQQRQTAPSICQYTSRRKGLSEIISNHSKSKERIYQLEQVSKIKERLTRNKIGINIQALSQGLCLPQDQQKQGNTFPSKNLPSNPFMVETKKKKKKK